MGDACRTRCRCGHPEVVHGGFARRGTECAYRGCACVAYAAVTLCTKCDGVITRFDLTMQGPRGPWVHEATKRRMCQGDFVVPRWAESPS